PEKVFVAPLMPPPRTHHVLGTLRMGSDPATSVVDPRGRFWDVDNLYAADGSVFPTSSGYNPTLTIIAVALRIAHGLAASLPITWGLRDAPPGSAVSIRRRGRSPPRPPACARRRSSTRR